MTRKQAIKIADAIVAAARFAAADKAKWTTVSFSVELVAASLKRDADAVAQDVVENVTSIWAVLPLSWRLRYERTSTDTTLTVSRVAQ